MKKVLLCTLLVILIPILGCGSRPLFQGEKVSIDQFENHDCEPSGAPPGYGSPCPVTSTQVKLDYLPEKECDKKFQKGLKREFGYELKAIKDGKELKYTGVLDCGYQEYESPKFDPDSRILIKITDEYGHEEEYDSLTSKDT